MQLAGLLLVIAATVGSIDALYYHLYKLRLFEQPSSRAEEVTHLVRMILFPFGLWIILSYHPLGLWYFAVAGAFGLELVNQVVDVVIEPKSRKPMGGLPGVEYCVHVLSSVLSGGAWFVFVFAGWGGRLAATALVPLGDASLPAAIVWDGKIICVSSVLLALFEGVLYVRSMAKQERATETEPSPVSAD